MNRKHFFVCALLCALMLTLTACQSNNIIGGADSPTAIIVGNGEIASADDADTQTQDAVSDTVADAAPVPSEEPPVPLSLALLSGSWLDAIQDALPVFEEAHNVVCEVRALSKDELHAALTSPDAPACDLAMVHSSSMPEFSQSGALANLSALGYKPESDFLPSVMEAATDGSAVLFAPWHGSASVLLCNKDSLIAAGSSVDRLKSLQNLLSVCKTAKNNGKIGFAYHQSLPERVTLDFIPILRSFDGWFVDHNGKPSIYTKKFQDAVNFFLELAAVGKALPNDEYLSAIESGDAVMGFIRSDAYIPSAKSACTYLSFSGAVAPDGESHDAGTCASWGLAVPADSPQPELAELLLEYLINPNIQKSTLSYGVVPCRYSILQDTELQKERPYYAKLCTALENSRYEPPLTQWPQMRDIVGEELWKVMAGRKLVTEALADAQSRSEALFAQ